MEREPWERQKGESRKAYQAFVLYRDAGPDRSAAAVGKKLGKSSTLMERWSARWGWVARAEAWDAHLDEIARREQEQARKEMLDRHARAAVAFQGKVIDRLREFDAGKLTAKDLARWFEVAVKVERLARGEPTENVAQEVKGQMTLQHSGRAYEIISDPATAKELQRILRERLGRGDVHADAGPVDRGHDGGDAVGGTERDPPSPSGRKESRRRKRERDR